MNSESCEGQLIEFDIHGLVIIRLVDPSPADIAAVRKQVGDFETPFLRQPDITIRFVKRLTASRLQKRYFATRASTRQRLSVFRNSPQAKAKIPFDKLGGPCEIVCESGLASVPLLMSILSLTALSKGYVAIHGSAFFQDGVGIIVAGGADSGKTTTLLGFVSLGADFIGDDCVLLSGDGQKMYGLAGQMELSPRHLEVVPHLRLGIDRSQDWEVHGIRSICREEVFPRKTGAFPRLEKAAARVMTILGRKKTPMMTPHELFAGRVGPLSAKPSKLFLLVNHDDKQVEVEATSVAEMAGRISNLAQQEQMSLVEHYQVFRSAFPNAKNAAIERMFERQHQLLSRALAGMETYTVRHPYPLVFSDLYKSIRPFCKAKDATLHSVVGVRSGAIVGAERTVCKI